MTFNDVNTSFSGPGPSGSDRHSDAPVPTVDLFDRYLAGDASSQEIAEVQQWLANFSDHRKAISSLRTMWAGQPAPSWNAQARWQEIAVSLAERSDHSNHATHINRADRINRGIRAPSLGIGDVILPGRSSSAWSRVWGTRRFMAIASAVILAAVGITGWQLTVRSTTPGIELTQMSSYTTPNGGRATITLPDGSRVTLNAGSRLEVPATFGVATRTVRLAGEAVFDVEHAQGTPFVVLAGASTTRVLGTRFLVRHYATDSSATISVQSGRVAVGTTVLAEQQQVSVSAAHVVTMHPMQSERFGFADGILQFNGASLAEIIPDLNRWYNADIQLGDQELASRIVVGGFPAGSVTDLVSMLEWTFNVRVVRTGRTLTLYSRAK